MGQEAVGVANQRGQNGAQQPLISDEPLFDFFPNKYHQMSTNTDSQPPTTAPADSVAPPMASYANQVVEESRDRVAPQLDKNASSIHAFSQAEKTAFVKHINEVLAGQKELKKKLPLNPKSDDIFQAVKDGLLLW